MQQLGRRRFIGASIATAAGGASAADGQAPPRSTLKVALAARSVHTLDPIKSVQGADNWTHVHVFDTLVRAPDGSFATTPQDFRPALAETWQSSADALRWSFKLHEGVAFHKGFGELTSDDVKFTYDRLCDPVTSGGLKVLFENIATVRTDGKYGINFALHRPDPLFLASSVFQSGACIVCRKAAEAKGDAIEMDPIGTGPYEFVRIDPAVGVFLKGNDRYFGGVPPTPNLEFHYILDTTARTLALLAGKIDMIEAARSPGWLPSIKARDPRLMVDAVVPGSSFTVSLNLTKKPFDDVRVRQALMYAIDRDAIAKSMAPISQRSYGLNPAEFPGGFTAATIPADFRYDHDPARAKHLLAEAGLPNGFAFPAFTSQREDYNSLMLMVQEQLRQIGVTVDLSIVDHTTFQATIRKDSDMMAQRSGAYPPVPTMIFAEQVSAGAVAKGDGSGGANYSHYGVATPGIDALLEQALNEADLQKRVELCQQMEQRVLADVPIIPLCTNAYVIVRHPRVKLGYEVKSGFAYWPLNKAVVT
jgi:peptide/nickel transport system substrate-binding protein